MTSRAAALPPRAAARAIAVGLLLPLVAGAACVFAFAPFYAWPIAPVALAALFTVWAGSGSARQAWLSGFAFGLGYFLAGVSWVYVSLHDFGGMPLALAALATFLFCAYLALFPAFAGWCAVRWGGPLAGPRLVIATGAFPLFEWLRGTLFTGFPWLTIGTSQVPSSPLAGYAPYVGAYGVSLAVAAAAACLASLVLSPAHSRVRFVLAGGLVALFGIAGLARLVPWTEPAGPPVTISLLQGNVPQQIKWLEEVRTRTLLEYQRMIFAAPPGVVVIPETALPAFLDELSPKYLQSLRDDGARNHKDILLGTVERIPHADDYDYYNSVVAITTQPPQSYRKRHLVPFGEFIPPAFGWVLNILHIPMQDFSAGPAHQPPLEAGGTRFGVAICYEDVFGEEVIDALPAAQVLLNVSNDAWFGKSFAAEQHLQASQMRALETGRWMVRSTNTGASAAIDEHGRVVARLPEFTQGTLVQQVVPRQGSTPYVRWGNFPAIALALAVAFAGAFRRPVARLRNAENL